MKPGRRPAVGRVAGVLILALWMSGAAGSPAAGEKRGRRLRLELSRPAPGETAFLIELRKEIAGRMLPCSGVEVQVLAAGESLKKRTDILGRAVLGAEEILPDKPVDRFDVSVTATVAGRKAQGKLTVSKEEMSGYFDSAVKETVDAGNRLARGKKYNAALRMYRKAMRWKDGSGRAVYNTALVYEKTGKFHSALLHYRQYLTEGFGSAQDRLDAKQKCISIVRQKLRRVPPVSKIALQAMVLAKDAIKEDRKHDAMVLYEIAQTQAPWWKEPYHRMGLLYEHMGYHVEKSYFALAKRNLRMFISAAGSKDKRAAAARKKIENIDRIAEARKAPKTVRKRIR